MNCQRESTKDSIYCVDHSWTQACHFDEPFSGLDPINANQLKEAILLKENSATIIFSSHQMANVEEICENICMMKKGEVLVEGNLKEIKDETDKRKVIVQADFDREILKQDFEIESYKEENDVISFM